MFNMISPNERARKHSLVYVLQVISQSAILLDIFIHLRYTGQMPRDYSMVPRHLPSVAKMRHVAGSFGRGSHSHGIGRRSGAVGALNTRTRISLARDGRRPGSMVFPCSRYHHVVRLRAVFLTWRMRSHTHHVRYYHAKLCPTRRMCTWWEPPTGLFNHRARILLA